MTDNETRLRTALRVAQSQFSNLQREHDRFYEEAKAKGWLNDPEIKNALMGHQHRISSSIHAAEMNIRQVLSAARS